MEEVAGTLETKPLGFKNSKVDVEKNASMEFPLMLEMACFRISTWSFFNLCKRFNIIEGAEHQGDLIHKIEHCFLVDFVATMVVAKRYEYL